MGKNVSCPRHVVLLGATGSIGESTAKVARAIPESMKLIGLSGYSNQQRLLELTQEFQPKAISASNAISAAWLAERLDTPPTIFHGAEGLHSLATLPDADLVIVAIIGTAGLEPALTALKNGKDLAIASKEILVMAGEAVMTTAQKYHRCLLPIDSEHSALFQCLEGRDPTTVRRLILTCSGGPFRKTPAEKLAQVTPEMALRHPTWNMGKKITIDSATLFNKGLEMIEARWLFNIPMEKIEVVIHPESIIHSMVEFVDGSVLAQLSQNDMMFPIQYAITYPHRVIGSASYLDLPSIGRLHFEEPRHEDFPALALARTAGSLGGTMPAVLNAANEAAVARFLAGEISFPAIWEQVAQAMKKIPAIEHPTLEELMMVDRMARSIPF